MKKSSFFLGATSFIYQDDILPNVKKLASVVDDIELVLFVVEDDNNLPSRKILEEIRDIAGRNNLGFTIHLPLGISLGDTDEDVRASSINQSIDIIDLTKQIDPRAYVLHLNTGDPGTIEGARDWNKWADTCCTSLVSIAAGRVPENCLSVENLESYDIERLFPVLDNTHVSLCLDIGHLWLQGKDPVHYIEKYPGRIRVVHLHGINKRDHSSLIHADYKEVKRVLDALTACDFGGVLTLEVFNEDDLFTSIKVVKKWALEREGGVSG
ncbi:MAG: sugar phosphate isomerase/epimerase [Spirochaetales bacterium]|nr:sugar phosphate isomerase/epimerase [Spirochaetales bacterium]